MKVNPSTPALEGPLLVSKILKLPVLVDVEELEALFSALPPFALFHVSGMCKKGEGIVSKNEFVARYAEYIGALKRGVIPTLDRPLFSPILTASPEALYTMEVDPSHELVKPRLPVVQVQPCQIHYSKEEGAFRPLVFGSDSIPWGLHFSYPQIYQNPKTQEIHTVGPSFPNTPLFKALQRWVRHHTLATPFLIEGRRLNVPIRLGKGCLGWINSHPGLVARGISVDRV